MEGRGGFLEGAALERAPDGAELDHRGHGRVELVVGPGGHLARVARLKVSEKLLGSPELICFQGSP